MRYRQITTRPAFASVERLTIVPLLPDGTLGALLPRHDDGAATGVGVPPPSAVPDGGPRPAGGGAFPGPAPSTTPLVLIHGEVGDVDPSLDGQEALDAAAAQITAAQAGLAIDRVQVVAAEGLPEAQHLVLWAEGWPSAEFAEHGARLEGVAADELRRRVTADQGLIPGGASAAWIVADVAATIARRGRGPS